MKVHVVESVLGFLPSQVMQERQRANDFLEKLISLATCSERIQQVRMCKPTNNKRVYAICTLYPPLGQLIIHAKSDALMNHTVKINEHIYQPVQQMDNVISLSPFHPTISPLLSSLSYLLPLLLLSLSSFLLFILSLSLSLPFSLLSPSPSLSLPITCTSFTFDRNSERGGHRTKPPKLHQSHQSHHRSATCRVCVYVWQ